MGPGTRACHGRLRAKQGCEGRQRWEVWCPTVWTCSRQCSWPCCLPSPALQARTRLSRRPWRVDDFDAFAEVREGRWAGTLGAG